MTSRLNDSEIDGLLAELGTLMGSAVAIVINSDERLYRTIASAVLVYEAASALVEPILRIEREVCAWDPWWLEWHQRQSPSRAARSSVSIRLRRPQARACRADRGRWKRRRCMQALRRSTACC